eukprot:2442031-Pleurochrysis_carterae.AAC.9
MLAQLEEPGLIKNLGEAVGHFVARADEARLNESSRRAGTRGGSNSSICSDAQSSSMRQDDDREGCREERVLLGCNTAGCSLSLEGTGGDIEKARALTDRAIGKHAKSRNVRVVGLLGDVEVEVTAVVACDALFELVVADFLSARDRRGECRNAAQRRSCRRARGSSWRRGKTCPAKSSLAGRIEDASGELVEVRLAFLNRTVSRVRWLRCRAC